MLCPTGSLWQILCEVGLKVAVGLPSTSKVLVRGVCVSPQALETFCVMLYDPGVLKVICGFWLVPLVPLIKVNSVLGVLGVMDHIKLAFRQVPIALLISCRVTLCPKQIEVVVRLLARILKSAVTGLSTRTVFSISEIRVQPSLVVLKTLNLIFQQPVPNCCTVAVGMVIVLPLIHEGGTGLYPLAVGC